MLYLIKALDVFVAIVHGVLSLMADREHLYTGEKRNNGGKCIGLKGIQAVNQVALKPGFCGNVFWLAWCC